MALRRSPKKSTFLVVTIVAFLFTVPQGTMSSEWKDSLIAVSKEIIKGSSLVGLDIAGKTLFPLGWTYFKPVLMPVVQKLMDRNPDLVPSHPRTEYQAKMIGEKAARDFANDKSLQAMLINNFEQLQSGQQLILKELSTIEGRIARLENLVARQGKSTDQKLDKIITMLGEGKEKSSRQITADIRLVDSKFGIVRENDKGEKLLYETYEIPGVIGQEYLTRLTVDTMKKSVTFRWKLTYPRPPKRMGCGDFGWKLIPSSDPTLHICQGVIEVPSNGIVDMGFVLTAGDPLGAYEIRYYMDGVYLEKFNFIIR